MNKQSVIWIASTSMPLNGVIPPHINMQTCSIDHGCSGFSSMSQNFATTAPFGNISYSSSFSPTVKPYSGRKPEFRLD